MIITLKKKTPKNDLNYIIKKIKELGYRPHISRGKDVTIIGMIGERAEKYRDVFESLGSVDHISEIEKPYKLASRDFKKNNTTVSFGKFKIGGPEIIVMAGPCAVENKEIVFSTAKSVKNAGAKIFRGGAFKPRSSPYAFQGLGEDGLKLLKDVGEKLGLITVSEAMSAGQIEMVNKYCDIIQIGARNVQNYDLLKEAGRQKKPVLLKRGMSTTIKEFLLSAEYILSNGNYNVILCERGIRTFENATRFTLDLNAVPVIKKYSHLPVIVDPSHGIGIREHVSSMAKAAVACGADGLMIEVHPKPEDALSDGPQSMLPPEFAGFMRELKKVAVAVGRKL